MICNSSTFDPGIAFQLGADGEFDAPDVGGAFLYNCYLTIKGTFNHKGGTLTHYGNNHGHIFLYTDVTFNRLENLTTVRYIRLDPKDGATITTFLDGIYSISTGPIHFKAAAVGSHTFIFGTASKSGTIDCPNRSPWVDDDGGGINFQAADQAYPVIINGQDWEWDMDPGAVGLQDIDYRIAMVTGGGGVTITANRCKFAHGLIATPGDVFHGTDVQIGTAPGGGNPGPHVRARGPITVRKG